MKKTKSSEEILAVLKKYGVELKEEDLIDFKEKRELSDDELDMAAGGCDSCSDLHICMTNVHCSYG